MGARCSLQLLKSQVEDDATDGVGECRVPALVWA